MVVVGTEAIWEEEKAREPRMVIAHLKRVLEVLC